MSRQATRLGLLPRLNVKHTSKQEGGQIYVGSINWILFVGVLLLIGIFQSSAALASAYGLAVTGTLLLTKSLIPAGLAVALLLFGFIALYLADLRAVRLELAPRWYPALRKPLTLGVVLCLLATWLGVMLAG